MEKKQFTVPEAGSVDVTFEWTDRTDPDNPQRIVKGFSIPPTWVRILNQFCVDVGRLDAEGKPDILPMFIEENWGVVTINEAGEAIIKHEGLLLRIYNRMKNEYEKIVPPELDLMKKQAVSAAKAASAAEIQVLASALVPQAE